MTDSAPDYRALYREHLAELDRRLADSLEIARDGGTDVEGVVFHSGRARVYHRDDEEIAFRPDPHYRRWVPPQDGPEHVVYAVPGRRPKVVRVRPRDFWVDTSEPPRSHWEDAVDLVEVETFGEVRGVLEDASPSFDGSQTAFVGASKEAADELGVAPANVEPDALMAPLDWHRAAKTTYEIELTRIACAAAARGHLRARELFYDGASERRIHWAYLEAAGMLEADLPYSTIVALDSKGAILHYQHKRGDGLTDGTTFLIDAGASHFGYAADLTRTWARDDAHPVFRELIRAVDTLERELVGMVAPGVSYVDLHLRAHEGVGEALARTGVLRCSAEEAVEKRLTRAFLPHGVGHLLGLQTHDVGGHQATPAGGENPPPDDHVLRNTRTLEPGHLVTVEPGVYFVPMLLDPHRESDNAGAFDWDLIESLRPHGGIRIEDDVLCTGDGHEDLSRELVEGELVD